MASTYTTNLGIEKIGTGEQSGTWGETTNLNFDILDQAINGLVSVTLPAVGSTGSPNTLPITDGALSDGRNAFIELVDGGDLGGTAYVQLTPNDAEKIAYVRNSLSGGQSVILFQGTYNASNDFELANGKDALLYFNGGGTGAVVAVVQANEVRSGSFQVDNIVLDGNTIDVDGDLDVDVSDGDIVLKDDGTTFGGLSIGGTDTDNLVIKSGSTPTAALTLHEGNVGFGTQDEALYLIDAQSASAGIQARFISTEAGATSGPDLKFYRNSASPADSDIISTFYFNANTDDGAGGVSLSDVNYGSIVFNAVETNETLGEAAGFALNLKRGGTTQQYISIVGGTTSDTDDDSIVFSTGGTAAITIDNSQNITTSGDFLGISVDGGTIKLDGNYPTGSDNVALGDAALSSGSLSGGENTAIGSNSLASNTSGRRNTAVGEFALASNLDGENNVAIGRTTLDANTSGDANTAVGGGALTNMETGSNNVAIGTISLLTSTTGAQNVAIGYAALEDNTSGNYNTAIGFRSGDLITTGSKNTIVGSYDGNQGGLDIRESDNNIVLSDGDGNPEAYWDTVNWNLDGLTVGKGAGSVATNTAVGASAMVATASGGLNTVVGYEAGNAITSGFNNTLVGYRAGKAVTTAGGNAAMGDNALLTSTAGGFNVAIGNSALQNNTASENVAVGSGAAVANTSGTYNVAIGRTALNSNTTASNNTAVGYQAGYSNTTSNASTYVGTQSGYSATGGGNTGVGYRATYAATGIYNTSVGYDSLLANTSGANNVALGAFALVDNTTGESNFAAGYIALGDNTSGCFNTAVGRDALRLNTTACNNTAIGYQALYTNTTDSGVTAVGYRAAYSTNGAGTGLTAIGVSALSSSTGNTGSVAVGYEAANNVETAGVVAIGYQSLLSTTTGTDNVGVGVYTLCGNITGQQNVAVGSAALRASTGSNNTAIGHKAMCTLCGGACNTALGSNALFLSTTGNTNTAVGAASQDSTTTGCNNTSVGYNSLQAVTTTSDNTVIGVNSGSLITGSCNTIIGPYNGNQCGLNISTSSNNIVLSDGAGCPRLWYDGTNSGWVSGAGAGGYASSNANVGFSADVGFLYATRDAGPSARFGRNTNDGTIVEIRQDNSTEGTISVSGTTVSYNGGHLSRWSRLADDSKDTSIVKGTVMTNLDAMVEWGDEDNEQLNKMAVSSVEGDANVAGVFVNWDEDDDWNDMNVAMTGDMVIRIASGTTVARGDLLMSAGDGTAKPQGDDIVRSKTIAKVTSTHVSHTYEDGSYLVPCVLMAC